MNTSSFIKFSFLIFFIPYFLNKPLYAQEKLKGSIEVLNETRKYRLYLPSTYSNDQAMPLVLNLHGLTSDPGQQQLYTRMNEVAEKNKFIVAG